jgi:hypothetical protein
VYRSHLNGNDIHIKGKVAEGGILKGEKEHKVVWDTKKQMNDTKLKGWASTYSTG